ncbi:unnamed protein product [Prorocentrum cordatum]|uniref:ABC transmembrane type-1 domain-containing protein n=1 Tax=Prorocentrum cordatum TaxID=2364126 RepID=A0ABN9WTB4_9DINO|nr:unnamed protein product [Polarella glacialis]
MHRGGRAPQLEPEPRRRSSGRRAACAAAGMDRFREIVRERAEAAAERSAPELVRLEVAAVAAAAHRAAHRSAAAVAASEGAGGAGAPGAKELGESVMWAELVALGSGDPGGSDPETIWEAIMLAGLPTVGAAGTAILVLGLLSSVGMQAAVCHTLGAGLASSAVLPPAAAASAAAPAAAAGSAAGAAAQAAAASVVGAALGTAADVGSAAAAAAAAAAAGGGALLEEAGALASEHQRLAAVKVADLTLSDAVLSSNPVAVAAVALLSTRVATPLLALAAALFWCLAVFRELRHLSESAGALAVLPRRATQLVRSGDTLVPTSAAAVLGAAVGPPQSGGVVGRGIHRAR